jgi:hypothetical protein
VTYREDRIDGIGPNRFRRALLLGPERRARMRLVHPPELFDRLLPFLDLDYEAVRRGELRPGRGLPETPCEVSRRRSRVEGLQVYVLQEALIENLALELYRTEKFDFRRLLPPSRHRAAWLSSSARRGRRDYGRWRKPAIAEERVDSRKRSPRCCCRSAIHGRILEASSGGGWREHPFRRSRPATLTQEATTTITSGERASALRPLLNARPLAIGANGLDERHDIAPTILYLFDPPVGSTSGRRRRTLECGAGRSLERYSRELMRTATPGGPDRPDIDEELDREMQEKHCR